MAPDEYATGGGGKLKLKGSKVSDGRVEKKKKKKNKTKQDGTTDPTGNAPGESQPDRESEQLASQQQHEKPDPNKIDPRRSNSRDRDEDRGAMVAKTEAERRYEEMRRRRVSEDIRLIFCQYFFLFKGGGVDVWLASTPTLVYSCIDRDG